MESTIVAIILLAIAAEGLLVDRARRRAEYENVVADRLARYAGQKAQRISLGTDLLITRS